MNPCNQRRPVSFRSKKGPVSFTAAGPGCPQPDPTDAQLDARERFADAAKTCARLEPETPILERAKKCVGPRLRRKAAPAPVLELEEPRRPTAPPPVRTLTSPKLKGPADLRLEAFRSQKLAGACAVKAQELAEKFCQRFTYNADLPGLAGPRCFNDVREVFLKEACRGE